MSENQVLEQEILEDNQTQTQHQTEPQTQTVPVPIPVVYASLLSKLRQHTDVATSTNEHVPINTNQNNDDKNKREPKPRQNGQYQQDFQRNNRNQQGQPMQPRLSPEDYGNELKKCQKVFFVHLSEYLKEQVIIKSKPEEDKKKEVKVIKKTNLERIQNGSSVNVMKLFLNNSENTNQQQKYINGLEYFDNLISNKQMNFFETLSNYMDKYNVVTSFRGKNNILIHSPYLMV
jgi:hypothetical protein